MTDLSNQRAMIVGAEFPAGGIIARALAAAGADLALCALTPDDAVMRSRRVRRDVEALGRRAAEYVMDVTLGRNVQVTTRQVAKEMGGIEVVVSAPELFVAAPLGGLSETELARVLQLNFSAHYFVVRTAAEEFRRQQTPGRILLVTSILGHRAVPGAAAFSAAHGAVHQLVRAAAEELRDEGIAVNAIALGMTETAEGPEPVVPSDTTGDLALDLVGAEGEFVTGRIVQEDGTLVGEV
jgi:NAD(P)-dependent dehydrogenase (short-subunit alcohol dehydrogenase family)